MSASALAGIAARGALVPLYHATFTRLPAALAGDVHNVAPAVLRAQLEQLGEHFRFVDVDTLAAMEDPRGHAAVTFDDGYASVFDEALPVFESLGIPCTVYLNGATLEGGVFWRDKVRLLQANGWVEEFEAFMQGIEPVPGRRFYRYTKDPRLDSARVDAELDRFLASRGGADGWPRLCVDNPADLPRHPLLHYGNHGHHHYVMSSLDAARQQEEIARTATIIDALGGARSSRWFSVPFGDAGDFNADTAKAVCRAGYRGVLLSRGRAHRPPVSLHGMPAVERFMPPPRVNGFWPASADGA